MSLILRLRQHFPSRHLSKPYISSPIASKPLNPNWVHRRNYAQAAAQQQQQEVHNNHDGVLEIDPRKLPSDYDPTTFDPTCHRTPPSARVFRLVDEVSQLTLREAAELGTILMDKMGMKEAPVMGVLKAGAVAGLGQLGGVNAATVAEEEKKEEKTVFELKLESFEKTSKLKVIKEIRACTEYGLAEAKSMAEKAPVVFRVGVSKEEGEKIAEKFKAVGAKVVLE